MGKILSAMFLAVALMVWMPQVSAQEVYAVTEKNGGKITDHYIVTESIQQKGADFGVGVHAVGQNYSHNEYWNVTQRDLRDF